MIKGRGMFLIFFFSNTLVSNFCYILILGLFTLLGECNLHPMKSLLNHMRTVCLLLYDENVKAWFATQ